MERTGVMLELSLDWTEEIFGIESAGELTNVRINNSFSVPTTTSSRSDRSSPGMSPGINSPCFLLVASLVVPTFAFFL